MPVNAGKRHYWEYCPCRYLPVNTAGKCHRPTLNFCSLNSGPLDLNRLKIIVDILNRLKCQNLKRQKHITEEPIRKHFISMP